MRNPHVLVVDDEADIREVTALEHCHVGRCRSDIDGDPVLNRSLREDADAVGDDDRGAQDIGIEAVPGRHQGVGDPFVALAGVEGVGVRQKRPGAGLDEQVHDGSDPERGDVPGGAGFPEVDLDGHQSLARDRREHPGAFKQTFDPLVIRHFHRGPQIPEKNFGSHAFSCSDNG